MKNWVIGHKVESREVTGDYDLVIGETPARTPGPPPHFHNSYHEVFIVTEGEMEFVVNGEKLVLKAGESVNLAPEETHTFSNNSGQPCRWVNIHSPKGFLSFFETLGVPVDEDDAHERSVSQETIQKVVETAASFDMVIVP